MRLISCYIENFGGLHRFSRDFEPGLTVLCQPNGFGKTTLAEFIRAMFYGMPRNSGKLEKNKRKKYMPWQGGVYGGSLTFSHLSRTLRIERTFGATPARDTFKLVDLQTGKEVKYFSRDIGRELFGLDEESFERSTYLPQLFGNPGFSTDSIQAKLGDLVDDTNDVNNYENAMEALRTRRRAYAQFKGSRGSIAEAEQEIAALQLQIDGAAESRNMLAGLGQQLRDLQDQISERQQREDRLQTAIDRAGRLETAAAIRRQLEEKQAAVTELQESIQNMERKYPAGIPDEATLEKLEELAERAVKLETDGPKPDPGDLEFWNANRQRFAGGLPAEENLQGCRKKILDCGALRSRAAACGVSEEETAALREIEAHYPGGFPEEEKIAALEQAAERLARLESSRTAMSREDTERLAELEQYFAAGIPTEAELLTQERNLVPEARQEEQPVKKTGAVAVLILGLLAFAAGGGLMLTAHYAAGGILLGAGILLLLGAAYLHLRSMIGVSGAAPADEHRRREAEGFAARYPGGGTAEEKLRQIRVNLTLLRELQRRQANLGTAAAEAGRQASMLRQQLSVLPECDDPAAVLRAMREDRQRYQTILTRQAAEENRRQLLEQQLAAAGEEITEFLTGWGAEGPLSQADALLQTLQADCIRFRQTAARMTRLQTQRQERERTYGALSEKWEQLLAPFALRISQFDRGALQQLRTDGKARADTLLRLEQAAAALKAFRAEQADWLAVEIPDPLPDPERLTAARRNLTEKDRQDAAALRKLEQAADVCREKADRLPELQDRQERLRLRHDEDMHRQQLLDDTMAFLEGAREDLAGSYVNPVRRSFVRLMNRMSDEEGGRIHVSPDLTVTLERAGQLREMTAFSAGQADLVLLCMRFALVEALFGDTRPFVILDDPFINLDDDHVARARALLQELSRDWQILYLTCHTARA